LEFGSVEPLSLPACILQRYGKRHHSSFWGSLKRASRVGSEKLGNQERVFLGSVLRQVQSPTRPRALMPKEGKIGEELGEREAK
jgi:hypothetical protein